MKTQHTLLLAALCLLLSSNAQAAPALLAYWPLDEIDTTGVAVDASGNGLDGTYNGVVVAGVPGAFGDSLGVDFSTANGSIGIGPGPSTINSLTGGFTISGWVSKDSNSGVDRFFSTLPPGFGVGTTGSDLRFTTFGIQDYNLGGAAIPTDGSYVHYAVVFDADYDAHFYIDGELVGTVAGGTPVNTTNNEYFIGARDAAGTSEPWDGNVDDLGVFDGELSATQIKSIVSLAQEEELAYDLGEVSSLLDLYDEADPSQSVEIDDLNWTIASSGPAGDLGEVVATSDGFFLTLGNDGSGIIASPSTVPEPASLAIWGALMIAGVAVYRRRRRK